MRVIVALFTSLFLSSCLNTYTFDFKTAVTTDHRYAKLIKLAETAPSSNAVIGLWHRKTSNLLLGSMHFTILFREDGSIVERFIPAGAEEKYATNISVPSWRWHYRGSGVWELLGSTDKVRPTMRVSGRYLLWEDALSKHVYTKAE